MKAEPRKVRCTNQACNWEDYIPTQNVRRATIEGTVKARIVGTLNQCCKCGTLYYATPDGCYPAPTQFQPIRSQFQSLAKPPAEDDKLPELPEP